MAVVTRISGDLYVDGKIRSGDEIVIPGGQVLDAEDLEHQYVIPYSQADGSDIVAAIMPVHIVHGATATIKAVKVLCLDAPEGGDKEFTVDLKVANVGTPAPATVLSAVVDYAAETPDCTPLPGTIASPSLVAGDALLVVVAVSGSTGNQGQGLIVIVVLEEDAA